MLQLIDPERYNALPLLWEGDAPPGERLADWVRKEWEHKPHEGETPIGVAAEVAEAAAQAVAAAEAAGPFVKKDREEYQRLLNDMRAMEAQYRYYDAKTRSTALVLRYGYSRDLKDLQQALVPLKASVGHYRRLVAHRQNVSRGMQCSQCFTAHPISRRTREIHALARLPAGVRAGACDVRAELENARDAGRGDAQAGLGLAV